MHALLIRSNSTHRFLPFDLWERGSLTFDTANKDLLIPRHRDMWEADIRYSTNDDGANENGKSLTRSCYNCDDWNEAVPSAGSI